MNYALTTAALFLSMVPGLAIAGTPTYGAQASRLTLLAQTDGPSACMKDTDCKGDRICNQGACQNPFPGPSAVSQLTPPPQPDLRPDSLQRMMSIDQRIQLLEDSRPSYAGPIVATVIGSLVFAPGFIIFLAASWPLGLIIMGLAAIPLGLGIGSLSSRSSEDHAITAQIRQLQAQRLALGYANPLLEPSLRVATF